jgi:hypothetical protein
MADAPASEAKAWLVKSWRDLETARRAGDGDSAVADRRYSEAQITAFEDSWHWGEQAEREFDELTPNTAVSEMMQALRRFLGENDIMAYLTMMANRLLQLHRVLKPTGSLYLHRL